MSYFIFAGKDCRQMGCRLKSPLPIIRPEERADHTQIPGRAGDLTVLEGTDVYNSYIHTASISVEGWSNVRRVYDWLRGSGYLTTSSEPDRRQQARVIGAITLDKISKNLDIWTGECQFYCQPLKELITPAAVSAAPNGAVVNMGDVTAKPIWTVTPSGTTVKLKAGGKELTVTGCTSGTQIIINSDVMEVTNLAGSVSLTKNASGEFPVLLPGSNTLTGSGWSAVSIRKNERFL